MTDNRTDNEFKIDGEKLKEISELIIVNYWTI